MGHLPQSGAGGMIEELAAAIRRPAKSSSTSTTPIRSWTRILRNAYGLPTLTSKWRMTACSSRCRSEETPNGSPLRNLPWSVEEFEHQLRAKGDRYHIHHPFQVRNERRALHARASAGLGVQSLLLSDQHSTERRRDTFQLPGPRRASRMDPSASSITTGPKARRAASRPGSGLELPPDSSMMKSRR